MPKSQLRALDLIQISSVKDGRNIFHLFGAGGDFGYYPSLHIMSYEVMIYMVFKGISKTFSLFNEDQYNTIGAFWDDMAELYGLENLQGLGYGWRGDTMEYAIGLKNGDIDAANVNIVLPDSGWITAIGKTESLKQLYDEIYKGGRLTYEIEEFFENGDCTVRYLRSNKM